MTIRLNAFRFSGNNSQFSTMLILCLLLSILLPTLSVPQVSGLKTINFSGYSWYVKSGHSGPGPNYWSNSSDSVWIDGDDRLHLKIINRNGTWYSSEVYLADSLGYGEYVFHLASRVDTLESNTVLGLFLYESDIREADIEFSKWGHPTRVDIGQYVITPSNLTGHLYRFPVSVEGDYSTHIIDWKNHAMRFRSMRGHDHIPPTEDYVIADWGHTIGSEFLQPEGGKVHINLWRYEEGPQNEYREQEVIVESFEFIKQVDELSISTPINQSTTQGGSATFQFKITNLSNALDLTNMTLLNKPPGTTVSWSQNPVTKDAVVTLVQLTIHTNCSTVPKSYNDLRITCSDGETNALSGAFSLTVLSSQNCLQTLGTSLVDHASAVFLVVAIALAIALTICISMMCYLKRVRTT